MTTRSGLWLSRPIFAGALLTAVAGTAGCSLLFRVDGTQCASTSECSARGAAFANHVCQAGTCVAAVQTEREAGSEGGVILADGSAAPAEAGPDAAQEAAPVEPRCLANSDCLAASATHPEVTCDVASGACIQLTTDECPLVIGDFSAKVAQPIFLGAFAELPPNAPQSHPSFLNYTLAIREFTQSNGVPGYDPVKRQAGLRMPVVVVCNAASDLHVAMQHLQGDVHVPLVVAGLGSSTLRTLFVNDAHPGDTFVINPFGADSTLTSLQTDGLLWHMLGEPQDSAAAYAAFMPRVEAYVRTLQSLTTTPMRVATVTANATVTQDLAEEAFKSLRWNDQSLAENRTAGRFLNIAVNSVLSGADLATIPVDEAVSALEAFKPNVIVSFAGPEFLKVLQVLELKAPSPAPFYVVGPYNMGSRDLLEFSRTESKRRRVAGVGVASAADPHVLNAYENRFLAQFLGGQMALGQENYYDAMYFAVYAMVGAGRLPKLRGSDVAQGMLRLLSGTSYDMGPSDNGSIVGALSSPNGTISLFGALGPPNFVRATGARIGEGSVYCVNRDSGNGSITYVYDTMRVAPGDGGASGLTGTFSCYSGL